MQRFRSVFFLLAAAALTSCETPLGQSWNNAVSRLSPQPDDDTEARNGIQSSRPSPRNIDSDTVYTQSTAPQSSSRPVRLKPFRQSAPANLAPTPKPTPRPTPKISSTPKSASSPSPRPTPKRQTAATPNLEKPEPEPIPKPVESTEPPPFASPVPGKKGYVTSPYSPDAGFIDVTGLDPGSLAKDPYSGKVFRVP